MDLSPREALSKSVVHMAFELTGHLRAHMDRCASAVDLTPMQARALFTCQVPVPMRGLADALHCDASNITGIVDRLEERGLMARVVDPDDRRRKMLVVTEEGQAVTEQLKQLVRTDHPVLSLDDERLEVLHDLLVEVLSASPAGASGMESTQAGATGVESTQAGATGVESTQAGVTGMESTHGGMESTQAEAPSGR